MLIFCTGSDGMGNAADMSVAQEHLRQNGPREYT